MHVSTPLWVVTFSGVPWRNVFRLSNVHFHSKMSLNLVVKDQTSPWSHLTHSDHDPRICMLVMTKCNKKCLIGHKATVIVLLLRLCSGHYSTPKLRSRRGDWGLSLHLFSCRIGETNSVNSQLLCVHHPWRDMWTHGRYLSLFYWFWASGDCCCTMCWSSLS